MYFALSSSEEDGEGEMNTSLGKGSTEATAGDPFYKVRDNINAQVERIRVKFDKFQDLLQHDGDSAGGDLREMRKVLLKELKAAEKDVRGLQVAIEMIEKNRDKFPHVRDGELENRRSYVIELQNVVSDIKGRADSEAVRRKLEADGSRGKRDALDESLSQMAQTARNPAERQNARFIKEQRLEAASMIGHQDEAIDSLGEAVDRLGQLGKEVNVELREQNIMLAGLEDDLDEAGNRMNMVMASLSKLLKTKDGCMIWTIVILFFVLALLVALVIWT